LNFNQPNLGLKKSDFRCVLIFLKLNFYDFYLIFKFKTFDKWKIASKKANRANL